MTTLWVEQQCLECLHVWMSSWTILTAYHSGHLYSRLHRSLHRHNFLASLYHTKLGLYHTELHFPFLETTAESLYLPATHYITGITLLWEQNMTFSQFWPKTSYYGIVVSYKVTSLSMVRWSNSFTAWQLFWPYSLIRYRLLNKLLWIVFVRSRNHNQEINTGWIAPSHYIINTSWIAPSLYKKPMSNMCEELKVWHNST